MYDSRLKHTLRVRREGDTELTYCGPPHSLDPARSTIQWPAEVVAAMHERGGAWVYDIVTEWGEDDAAAS